MKMASLKMYLTAVVSFFLVTIYSVNGQSHVPVLMWESSNVGGNDLNPAALSKMDVEEFADVLMRRVDQSPMIVLFSEDTLSVEDFSRPSASTGTSFPALQSTKADTRLEFIPAVQTPIKALNRLSKLGYKWEQLSGEMLPEPGKKILVVDLGDLKDGEDRSAMLLRHDKRIVALSRQMSEKYPGVLAIYTGRRTSWTAPETSIQRIRRDADSNVAPGATCNTVLSSVGNADQIMLYTSDCPVLTIENKRHLLTSGDALAPDTRKDVHRMVVRYKLDNSTEKGTVRFRFNFTNNGYWRLTQAEYEDGNQKFVLDSKSDIGAPNNFAYSCGSESVFQNAERTVTLTLKNIKVQPGVRNGVFASAQDCVPFFTIPIWSGLFVTFLLLFIVAWGIDMMMSIHTMDRFDDPKGKQLVFNAQD